MKKQVLYFAAGIFLTLSVFSFWAFKKDKSESGYAVVELHEGSGNSINTRFIYAEGKSEEKKYKKMALSEGSLQVLNEMDVLGYSYSGNYAIALTNGETNGIFMIFKKK